jgi:hypothetical protein
MRERVGGEKLGCDFVLRHDRDYMHGKIDIHELANTELSF